MHAIMTHKCILFHKETPHSPAIQPPQRPPPHLRRFITLSAFSTSLSVSITISGSSHRLTPGGSGTPESTSSYRAI